MDNKEKAPDWATASEIRTPGGSHSEASKEKLRRNAGQVNVDRQILPGGRVAILRYQKTVKPRIGSVFKGANCPSGKQSEARHQGYLAATVRSTLSVQPASTACVLVFRRIDGFGFVVRFGQHWQHRVFRSFDIRHDCCCCLVGECLCGQQRFQFQRQFGPSIRHQVTPAKLVADDYR